MDVRSGAQKRLWIRREDSLGNEIDRRLIEAAYRVWEPARFVVIRYLNEDTEAAEILESVVDSASRARNGSGSIQHIDAYLLKSVAREAVRRRRRSDRIHLFDPIDLEKLIGSTHADLDRRIDEERWIMLLRASLDRRGCEILDYRLLEYSWRSIAAAMGYASGHSAEVQFQKSLSKALRRIELNQRRGLRDARVNQYDE
jgi:hypothetical protein